MTHQLNPKWKCIYLLLNSVCFAIKSLSLKCERDITSSVCSWYDWMYGIYKTDGHITSAFEYGCDVYGNTLEMFCQIQRYVKELFFVY